MHFSSSRVACIALGGIAALIVGMSGAAVATKSSGPGSFPKPFQKKQAQDYAKSTRPKASSACVPTCKTKPAKYGCKVLYGVAAGGAAGLEACCRKACGG